MMYIKLANVKWIVIAPFELFLELNLVEDKSFSLLDNKSFAP